MDILEASRSVYVALVDGKVTRTAPALTAPRSLLQLRMLRRCC